MSREFYALFFVFAMFSIASCDRPPPGIPTDRAVTASTPKPTALPIPLETRDWKVENCQVVWTNKTPTQTRRECYHEVQWRTAHPLSTCPDGDRSGLLCYPRCREGYSGVGPVCWQQCKPGYTDDGAFCRVNVSIIGANNDRCPWYDKCGLTFERGCSVCPAGYDNDGCTCRRDVDIYAKDSYTRGAGKPMSCESGLTKIGALCYENCPAQTKPISIGVQCEAIAETCRDVPIVEPPEYNRLRQFCFKRTVGEYCSVFSTYAETEGQAQEVADCGCENCENALLPNCDYQSSVCD